jgi:hypothetical protein
MCNSSLDRPIDHHPEVTQKQGRMASRKSDGAEWRASPFGHDSMYGYHPPHPRLVMSRWLAVRLSSNFPTDV